MPSGDILYQYITLGKGIPLVALHVKLIRIPSNAFDGPYSDTVLGTTKKYIIHIKTKYVNC